MSCNLQSRALIWLAGVVLALAPTVCGQVQVRVVNMIPETRSLETNQDSEPNLAVNPANPLQIAGSAFTPDPLALTSAPIFVSTDGGNTWLLNSIVPSGNGSTGDITLRFGGMSNILYAGTLRGGSAYTLNILRALNFTNPTLMELLVNRTQVDQPYVQAATVLGGGGAGNDRVYVGNNDFGTAGGQTARIDHSLDAALAAAVFNSTNIESRPTWGQDAPPIRPAIHPNGTIYAIFYRISAVSGVNLTVDVVVVRDDNWAQGGTPFTALTDTDTNSGVRVVQGRTVPFVNASQPNFGQERFVASNLSIAVDPHNSARVFIAWADRVGANDYTLHVRNSTNSGASGSWSGDLLTITNATNPALAINSQGVAGFLYQQVIGTTPNQRWETHLRTSPDGVTWTDLILAQTPANPPAAPTAVGRPYLGDYAHLQALGKDFYGIFSASNTPDNANFPNLVTYQRFANFTTNQLFADAANTVPVPASIDPFFFKATMLAAADDFYVRDWTDSPTSGDNGAEPSIKPYPFSTSDVWNRRGTLPGAFPNDQPESEDAGNGDPLSNTVGDNWAFARIRRNDGGSGPKTVNAHFLVSQFGTGSSYVDLSTFNPTSALDPTVTFNAGDTGPFLTAPYFWHLPATASTHLCMAVEISTTDDPFVAPSLWGNTPGWPTTDLRLINDNNKAQRNLGLSTTPARGIGGLASYYAIAHNAALFPRDMILRYETDPATARRLAGARVEVIGGASKPFKSGDTIVLGKMQPGENRWVGFSFTPPQGKEGEVLPVNFAEMIGKAPINGFTIAAKLASTDQTMRESLKLHRAVFARLAAAFGDQAAGESADYAQRLFEKKDLSSKEYQAFLKSQLPSLRQFLRAFVNKQSNRDPFNLLGALQSLDKMAHSGQVELAAVEHASFCNRLDAFETQLQLAQGDLADILQNVRWQLDLYTRQATLNRLKCAAELRNASQDFIRAYGERRINNQQYSKLIESLADCFSETARNAAFANLGLGREVEEMKKTLGNLQALQKTHRNYLLKLQSVAK